MATVLDKELRRQVTVDGIAYTLTLHPGGFRLTGKGKRIPEVELRWHDLLNGDTALATALNASLGSPAAAKPATKTTSKSARKLLPKKPPG